MIHFRCIPATCQTALLCLSLLLPAAGAAEQAKTPAPTASPAAPQPTAPLDPTDLERLRPLVGQEVTLEGTVVKQSISRSRTVRYLNFTPNYRQSVSLVFFLREGSDSFTEENLEAFVGKRIRVTGQLTQHRGVLQMQVDTLARIEVLN